MSDQSHNEQHPTPEDEGAAPEASGTGRRRAGRKRRMGWLVDFVQEEGDGASTDTPPDVAAEESADNVTPVEDMPVAPPADAVDAQDADAQDTDVQDADAQDESPAADPWAPDDAAPAGVASDDAAEGPRAEATPAETSAVEETDDEASAEEGFGATSAASERFIKDASPEALSAPESVSTGPSEATPPAPQVSLGDPVAEALCTEGHVAPAVAERVQRQLADPHAVLWRELIAQGHVPAAAAYATAAEVLAYEAAPLTPEHPDADFVNAILRLFPAGVQETLQELNVLPVAMTIDPEVGGHLLTVATHDPSCEEVDELVRSLGMTVTRTFAPEAEVRQRLRSVLGGGDDESNALEALARSARETPEPDEETTAVSPSAAEAGSSEPAEPTDATDDWAPLDPTRTASLEDTVAEEPAAEEPAAEHDVASEDRMEETTSEALAADAPADEGARPVEGRGEDALPAEASTGPEATDDDLFGFDGDDLGWEPFAGFGDDDEDADPFAEADDTDGGLADNADDDTDPGSAAADPSAPAAPAEPVRPDETSASEQAPATGRPEEPAAPRRTQLKPEQHGIDADELAEAVHTDRQAEEDVLVEDEIEPAEPFGADAEEGASFDGSSIDLPDDTPVADTNWGDDEQPNFAEETLDDPELQKIKKKDRVIAALFGKGAISTEQLRKAKIKRDEEGLKESFWRILAQVEGVDRAAIFGEAASVYAFPTADIRAGKPDPEFARSVTDTFDEEYRDQLLDLGVLPYEVDLESNSGAIKVAFITHDPTRPDVHRMMQKLKLERFELRYAPERVVRSLIAEAFPRKNEYLERIDDDGGAMDLGTSYDEDNNLVDDEALEAEMSRSKLINLFEATLVEATRQGVSDIHIWPNADKQVEIHFRLDGRLQRWHVEKKVHPEALIAVIKDNSMNVDRFERDAAQDGFIQRWIDETLIRFRVSVMPIANAASEVRSESIVIRVLDDRKVIKDLRKLGLQDLAFDRFKRAISQPHGMVILTGPTGSGKTTTLYAALHEVVSPEVNVLTVEDPVEYILPGVRQIKLNNKLGLEDALRSILRHDPDVVMVGEMRDRHTAELAIKLANTGHLTFSTLHTNDAASAVSRLYKMGVEPFLIAYAINLVVAQRLIRKLCPQCKRVDHDPDPIFLKNLGFTPEDIEETTFYTEGDDRKCSKCGGLGYKGRRAVTEAMYFTRQMRHLIADSEGKLSDEDIKDLAVKDGMLTLQDSAKIVVQSGETSAEEMMRVVASRD